LKQGTKEDFEDFLKQKRIQELRFSIVNQIDVDQSALEAVVE
jgi:hypothetical protein